MQRTAWWGVGFAYIGTVMGAGFASGQEIWQFFSRHGAAGVWGIGLVGLLFALVGYLALDAGRTRYAGLDHYFQAVYGRWAPVAVGATIIFLVSGIAVVVSAGGAAVTALVGVSPVVGGLAILALVLWTARRGPRAVMRVNTVVVPCLLGFAMLVSVAAHPLTAAMTPRGPGWWWSSALVYASYNLFAGCLVLLGLGRQLADRSHCLAAALLASVILVAAMYSEHRVLLAIGAAELPMVGAAQAISPWLGHLYAVCLLAALYTTGINEVAVLVSRFGVGAYRWLWLTALMAVWPLSGVVALVYPVLGLVGAGFWGPLLCNGSGHFRLPRFWV